MFKIKPCPKCGKTDGICVLFQKYRKNPERAFTKIWEDALDDYKNNPVGHIDYPVDIFCECGYNLEIQKDLPVAMLVWNALERRGRQSRENTSLLRPLSRRG